MTNFPKRKKNNRLLRLLTFVCFFNFSGLNNGYTYLTVVSPLDGAGSISLVGTAVKKCHTIFTTQGILTSIGHGSGLFTNLTQRLMTVSIMAFAPRPERKSVAGVKPASSRAKSAIQPQTSNKERLEYQRESYFKEEKRVWSKREEYKDSGPDFPGRIAGITSFSLQTQFDRLIKSVLQKSSGIPRNTFFHRITHSRGEDAGAFNPIDTSGMMKTQVFSNLGFSFKMLPVCNGIICPMDLTLNWQTKCYINFTLDSALFVTMKIG